MTSILIFAGAFIVTYWLGRKSLWKGIAAALTIGYAYGIARAHLSDTYMHLLFDAAVAGLFAAQLQKAMAARGRLGLYSLKCWTVLLIGWPTLLFFVGGEDILVQLVGWRANAFLLPCLVIGAQLEEDSLYDLALAIGVLNIVAAVVAALEFTFGVQTFFPLNDVTAMLYQSRLSDEVSLGLRIPSTFVNSHAYGGTMVMTLPFIFGAWIQKRKPWHTRLLTVALIASLVGVFMAGARTPMLVLAMLVGVVTFSGRLRGYTWASWVAIALVVGWLISTDVRLQRFMSLQDTAFLAERWTGSVNRDFFDLMSQYPLGRGLAGGGTSIPYFLQDRFEAAPIMENEFARIVLEQGVPGLFIWILFMIWVLAKGSGASTSSPWFLSRRLMWATAVAYFLFALTGIGLLTSIPQSMVLLLGIGWISVRKPAAMRQYVVRRAPNPDLAIST